MVPQGTSTGRTTDGTIGHSGGNDRRLVVTDRDPVPTCKVFVKSVFVLFLALCIKYMEPLSFDSPAETDVGRRFPTSAKGFVSASTGTRTRDLARSSHSAAESPGEEERQENT